MKELRRKLKKIWDTLCKIFCEIETCFIAIFTLIVGALIIFQIIRRVFGFQGWPWLDELSRYMLIITTFIGCSIAVKSNGHAVMDVLYTYIPPRPAYLLKSVVYALCGLMFLYLGSYSHKWMLKLKLMKRTWETLPIPFWTIWAFFVFALVTMGLRYFVQSGKCIESFVKHKKEFTEMNTKEM